VDEIHTSRSHAIEQGLWESNLRRATFTFLFTYNAKHRELVSSRYSSVPQLASPTHILIVRHGLSFDCDRSSCIRNSKILSPPVTPVLRGGAYRSSV
jgi:hypothetical protein